jgi:translocation protein SEC62
MSLSNVLVPEEFRDPIGLRTLANYLRNSSHGVKSKPASQHEKRVEYFRGARLISCLYEEEDGPILKKWPKTLPKLEDKAQALLVAELLLRGEYFHRSEKEPDKKNPTCLRIAKHNVFEEVGYYTWMYEGSMMWSNIGTGALVAAVIGFTLLPIWPDSAKRVLWYMSCTFLIFTLTFCTIRFVLFLLSWLCGYEFWIFPNLFDESLTFYDSFKPIYIFESAANGQGFYRLGLFGGLVAFSFWVMTQPTEFDTFIQGQKHFLDDLYSGNLLADVAADHKENLDKPKRNIPSFEDLLREDEDEIGGGSGIAKDVLDKVLDEEFNDEEVTARILEELNRIDDEEEAAEAARD